MVSDVRKFSVLSSKLVVDFLVTDMPPKSAAERMKAYRSWMSEERKTLMQEKNKEQQQKSRGKWDENRKKLEIELSKVRIRKSRNKRAETKIYCRQESPRAQHLVPLNQWARLSTKWAKHCQKVQGNKLPLSKN